MGYLKILVGALLLVSSIQMLTSIEVWWFMQNVNLIFHEAGHIFLMPFGELLMLLGGSLFEILVPLTCVTHFMLHHKPFSAAFCCWWLITALVSVSIYINDADTLALPLITGDSSHHDWMQILSMTGLYRHDETLSFCIYLFAIATLVLMVMLLYKDIDVQKVLKRT